MTYVELAGWPRHPFEGVEESPDSVGQDAGESARRGDPWQVQQRADRLSLRATAGR